MGLYETRDGVLRALQPQALSCASAARAVASIESSSQRRGTAVYINILRRRAGRTATEDEDSPRTVAAQLFSGGHPNGARKPKCAGERQRARTMCATPLSLSTAGAPFLFALSENEAPGSPWLAGRPRAAVVWALQVHAGLLCGHADPCFARQRDASRIGALKL